MSQRAQDNEPRDYVDDGVVAAVAVSSLLDELAAIYSTAAWDAAEDLAGGKMVLLGLVRDGMRLNVLAEYVADCRQQVLAEGKVVARPATN